MERAPGTGTTKGRDPTALGPAGRSGPGAAGRGGVALCLSGGGYRATLFHLGASRRLDELGILRQIDTFSAVSGGSIFAGFLATRLLRASSAGEPPDPLIPDWETSVAQPVRRLCRRNVRSRARLMRLHPKNWLPGAARESLARQYARSLEPIPFQELGGMPRFVFCATDLEFGAQWRFDSGLERAGSDAAGYVSPVPRDWTLPRVVAASSAVPGVFPSMFATEASGSHSEGTYKGPDRAARTRRIPLCDGGVYDNLGLEPVWAGHGAVLVSDASPTYESLYVPKAVWHGLRYPILLLDQATDVRRRWLASQISQGEMEGAYWSIGSPAAQGAGQARAGQAHDALMVYPDFLVETIARIRIDLDSFSEGEIATLENHGYARADEAVSRGLPHLIRRSTPFAVPHPEWMDPERAARALVNSHRTRLPGRGLVR